VALLERERFVTTFETGFHLAVTRASGRAPRGERVVQRVPRKRGTRVSLIGSLGLRGVVSTLALGRGGRYALLRRLRLPLAGPATAPG
jgi:hypothetical protein